MTSSDSYVTTQSRIPATQTAVRAKHCFIHAKAVTKKVLGIKAVQAVAQLFIKERNVS